MNKYDKPMIETAKIFAQQSYCTRRKVGAVLAKDGRILATGYNGTISGQKNQCEDLYYECPNCESRNSRFLDTFKMTFREVKEPASVDVVFTCKNCGKEHNNKSLSHQDQGNMNGADISLLNTNPESFFKIKPEFKTSEFVLHAEQNIITYSAKNGIKTDGCTLYITDSPCKNCAKLIAQSGISRVVYAQEYRDTEGVEFLNNLGIPTEFYKEDSEQN